MAQTVAHRGWIVGLFAGISHLFLSLPSVFHHSPHQCHYLQQPHQSPQKQAIGLILGVSVLEGVVRTWPAKEVNICQRQRRKSCSKGRHKRQYAFNMQEASFAQLPIRSMKISTLIGLTFTTVLYGCFASITYGAFGDSTPANILSNSGNGLSYAANTCVVLHLLLDFKEYGLLVFESIERHFHVDGEIWWQRCVSALGRIMYVILTYVAAGLVPKFLVWSGIVTAVTCFPLFAVGPFVIYKKQHEDNIRKSGLFLLYGYLFVSIVMVLFLVAGTVFYLIKVYHKFDY